MKNQTIIKLSFDKTNGKSEYFEWRKKHGIEQLELRDRQQLSMGAKKEYWESNLPKLLKRQNGNWYKFAGRGAKEQLDKQITSFKKIIKMYK